MTATTLASALTRVRPAARGLRAAAGAGLSPADHTPARPAPLLLHPPRWWPLAATATALARRSGRFRGHPGDQATDQAGRLPPAVPGPVKASRRPSAVTVSVEPGRCPLPDRRPRPFIETIGSAEESARPSRRRRGGEPVELHEKPSTICSGQDGKSVVGTCLKASSPLGRTARCCSRKRCDERQCGRPARRARPAYATPTPPPSYRIVKGRTHWDTQAPPRRRSNCPLRHVCRGRLPALRNRGPLLSLSQRGAGQLRSRGPHMVAWTRAARGAEIPLTAVPGPGCPMAG